MKIGHLNLLLVSCILALTCLMISLSSAQELGEKIIEGEEYETVEQAPPAKTPQPTMTPAGGESAVVEE